MRSILLTLLFLTPALAAADPADAPADSAADPAPADSAADPAPAPAASAVDPVGAPAASAVDPVGAPAASAVDPVGAPATSAADPAPAAGSCTYEDLQGQFSLTVDCALLQDHTGISQDHKRIWLGGARVQFNIIEVPDPYRTVELDHIMGVLGRQWGSHRTPEPAHATTFAGLDARVVVEQRQRSTSRAWVFNLNGRNVIANAVALGKNGKQRRADLEELTAAIEAGFKLN